VEGAAETQEDVMNHRFASVVLALATLTLGACSRGMPTAPRTNTTTGSGAAHYGAVASAHDERASATVFTGAGDITGTVNAFRAALGTLNANTPGSQAGGRREINWDAVPAQFTNTNDFPADFFNQPVVGRARGVVSTTPGTGERVSDVNFADLNPEFANEFHFFSPIRTFAPLGSNRLTVTFFVPGSSTPAISTGFGVVFSDVDRRGSASIRLLDAAGEELGRYVAPASPSGLSFVGVVFPSARVAQVEIKSGEAAIDAGVADISVRERGDDGDGDDDRDALASRALTVRAHEHGEEHHIQARDLVIMDDFIYGEPIAAPASTRANADTVVSGSPLATR
jgi:hypothetical protein